MFEFGLEIYYIVLLGRAPEDFHLLLDHIQSDEETANEAEKKGRKRSLWKKFSPSRYIVAICYLYMNSFLSTYHPTSNVRSLLHMVMVHAQDQEVLRNLTTDLHL